MANNTAVADRIEENGRLSEKHRAGSTYTDGIHHGEIVYKGEKFFYFIHRKGAKTLGFNAMRFTDEFGGNDTLDQVGDSFNEELLKEVIKGY